MEFFTIGVYNTDERTFFEKLKNNSIDTFCDIRQRRGVRGSKYSFVNSEKLQRKLQELDIKYLYISDLAPSTEIRDLQKKTDTLNGELKYQRQELGSLFVNEYENRILRFFDFDKFKQALDSNSSKRVALFCVEEKPKACHRSLVAEALKKNYNLNSVNDL